jgi:hypothetical protein
MRRMTGRTTRPGDVVRSSWRASYFRDTTLRRRADNPLLLAPDEQEPRALVLAQKDLKDAAGESVPYAYLLFVGCTAAWVCCYDLVLVRGPSRSSRP